ncbi:MAG: ZIP family metal transporter [Bacilli bacterium]|nr:ZIP family metal transporter [Bacilli bacterium]
MIEFLENLNPVVQALLATLMTYLFTMAGSALVFFFKKTNRNMMDAMLGIAGGVMIAASFFSLLAPAIDKAEGLGQTPWIIVPLGFLLGGILLFVTDKISSKVIKNSSNKKNFMLMLSITIHNIPEGLVVGLGFGSLIYGDASLMSAFMLALGIGIQNFPEGSSISLPLRRSGMSRKKAFFFGQISGIVEPIAGVLGALLILKIESILPISLAFAAGAMIYVVVEEIIPESQTNKRKDLMAFFTLIGFIIMMVLDVGLG